MKIRIFILTLAFALLASYTKSQNNQKNIVDSKGYKQGYWEKTYSNGQIKYKGFFKDNKPVGDFKRYDVEGNLKAEMTHFENSNKVYAKFYYPQNIIQAEGYYINKQKDSIWNYYTTDKYLINSVSYKNNKKEGVEKKFYPSGSVSEIAKWKDGLNEGTTTRYYEKGNIMSIYNYKKGKLDGEYKVYGVSNNILIHGNYSDNRRDGKWIYYKEDATVEKEITYTNGIADNAEELERLETEYMKLMEKNKGKFKDPMDQMYNAIPPM